MLFRKAVAADGNRCLEIYNSVCDWEEVNERQTFWDKEFYPNMETVQKALTANEMYVLENEEAADRKIVACGIINQFQPEIYKNFDWKIAAAPDEVLVLHTFAVDPGLQGKGYGRAFMSFYESLAKKMGCKVLRLDTLLTNTKAQSMYKKLGFELTGQCNDDPNGVGEILTFLGLEKGVLNAITITRGKERTD